ncbi:uncharacterized protein LOC106472986, partial [Limulus polyphemus]|uniref:Uncharacterized protein LOC106472986 n=1 Tax=Limulus polyphemus TaxID=6850 RepID=A0ABM1BUU7_LIMPO
MPSKHKGNVWTILPISKGYLSGHLVFVFVTSTLQLTYGQCIGGTVSFEKIAGTTLREAVQTPLYSIAPSAREADNPVTAECTNRCRASPDCPAFLINYDRRACFALNIISEGRRESLMSSPDKANYFEKICLKASGCERAWAFERVVGKELLGFDDRVIGDIPNKLECQELCLQERVFPCRSGEYDYTLQQCRLSTEDRRSQPSSFRPAIGDVDYFENQCVDNTGGPGQCQYEQKNDLDLQQPDLLRSAFSPEQCRALCDGTRAFICRSFTFQPSAARCWLSSDDVVSVGARALVPRSEVFFYQRSNCLDLKLTCSSEAMKLTLKTLEPFDGRIFAKSAPHKCETYGNRRTSTIFELPLVSENCGGRKE